MKCMNCQILFCGKKKKEKSFINLSSADLAHRVVKVNLLFRKTNFHFHKSSEKKKTKKLANKQYKFVKCVYMQFQ